MTFNKKTYFTKITITIIIFFLIFNSNNIFGQTDTTRTVGLLLKDDLASSGYTLFGPMSGFGAYLIDNDGREINSWQSKYGPGLAAYLLDDGSLLRSGNIGNQEFKAGGSGGIIEIFDWEGNITWSYKYSTDQHCQHHDLKMLPNGNILLVAWDYHSEDSSLAAGRNPSFLIQKSLWSESIIEIKPTGDTTGQIVWEWHLWDHLVQDYDSTKANYGDVQLHPELIDINFVKVGDSNGNKDWTHANSVDFNEKLDQIIISIRNFSELWIIDHSTTTEEATGHSGGNSNKGGDILYRWGNPLAYKRGVLEDQKLFAQHDAQWIKPGLIGEEKILIFNNGLSRGSSPYYSSIDEIIPPIDSSGNYSIINLNPFKPELAFWSFYSEDNPSDFYSPNVSGTQRLENGNTLICNGRVGHFFEVTPQNEIVWKYVNPVGIDGPINQGENPETKRISVFKIHHYPENFIGFEGKDLTPGDFIEIYPNNVVNAKNDKTYSVKLDQNYPNPFNPSTTINYSIPIVETRRGVQRHVTLKVYDILGKEIATLVNKEQAAGNYSVKFNSQNLHAGRQDLSSGIYFYQLIAGKFFETKKMILVR